MLKFDFTQKPDDRPYTLGTSLEPARNPITVSMTGKCVRAQAYHYRGEPKAKHPNLEPVKTEMTFAVGTAVHEALQRGIVGLRDAEALVGVRDGDFHLEGRIDGIVPVQLESGETVLALLEMKTMNPYGYKRFVDNGEIDHAYEVQANTYVSILQMNGHDVNAILWVMIERGSLEMTQSLRPFNADRAETGMNNAKLASSVRPEDLKRLEPRDGKLNWQCAYCDFWRSCWPDAVAPSNGKVELRLEVEP